MPFTGHDGDDVLMDADFSIELGREDPVLDFPWKDPAGKLAYVDLKRHPELMARIEEAEQFPELGEFLRALNSPRSMVETAKCDAWENFGAKRGRRSVRCVA